MISLDLAVCYDEECLPNCFTLTIEFLHSDVVSTWEISEFRDDRVEMFKFLDWAIANGVPFIGFNNLGYDYILLHYILCNRDCTYLGIYLKNQEIFASQGGNRYDLMIWDRDRLIPQIDLYKLHHFDNKAKSTSLKSLQFNMRSQTLVDSPVQFGTRLSWLQIENDLIPYNKHDVKETKRFALISLPNIEFRINLISQFGLDVLNYNDVKIGCKMLEQRLGDDVCYDRSSGRKVKRQTIRSRIALRDIIFPYVSFQNPEFQRVHAFMNEQVLTPEDIDDPDAPIVTKGVFKNLIAHVGGIDFYFGTGGVHASIPPQRVIASEEWLIRDIDVEGLYPNIAIVNKLAPAHLGQAYVNEYAKIPIERKTHKKGTVLNALFKLAANGPWGQSNNIFSPFYDPQYAMTIPVNGQLMICMLAERLITVPTLRLVQCNTDGITYYIHRDYEPQAVEICKQWQAFTCLKLEDANYSAMYIRDVNNYVAVPVTTPGDNKPPAMKLKGAYWSPDANDYEKSISTASPSAWYKDLSNVVSIRAAVAAMTTGVDPEMYIRMCTDPFDFMCRAKAPRGSELWHGDRKVQSTSRYYVGIQGAPLVKISPPKGPAGQYKKANGVTDAEYARVMHETGGQWDARVCTKNKSRYDDARVAIEAGYNIALCNDAREFRFDNVNYAWYVSEARKLIIT